MSIWWLRVRAPSPSPYKWLSCNNLCRLRSRLIRPRTRESKPHRIADWTGCKALNRAFGPERQPSTRQATVCSLVSEEAISCVAPPALAGRQEGCIRGTRSPGLPRRERPKRMLRLELCRCSGGSTADQLAQYHPTGTAPPHQHAHALNDRSCFRFVSAFSEFLSSSVERTGPERSVHYPGLGLLNAKNSCHKDAGSRTLGYTKTLAALVCSVKLPNPMTGRCGDVSESSIAWTAEVAMPIVAKPGRSHGLSPRRVCPEAQGQRPLPPSSRDPRGTATTGAARTAANPLLGTACCSRRKFPAGAAEGLHPLLLRQPLGRH